MDFGRIDLPQDLVEFWSEVGKFYDEHLPPKAIDQERADGNGFVPSLERALGERGWRTPTWPEREGGPQAAILRAEEARRVGPLFPVKGSTELVAGAVRHFGSMELREEILSGVARGELTLSLGYTEPDCGSDAAAIRTRAVRDGEEWVISGQKMFSTGSHLTQYVMATTRTNPDAPKRNGITMFLIPLDRPGVEIRGIGTLGGERTNFIYFDEVRVEDRYRLGAVDQGWAVASRALAEEHHMDVDEPSENDAIAAIVGTGGWVAELRRAWDSVVAWLADAQNVDGRAVLEDPGVRVRLARIALDCEVIDVTPDPYRRVTASDLLIRDSADLMDLLGEKALIPASVDGAGANGRVEHLHRFAQGTAIYGGTVEIQRSLIAEQVLGLPRGRKGKTAP